MKISSRIDRSIRGARLPCPTRSRITELSLSSISPPFRCRGYGLGFSGSARHVGARINLSYCSHTRHFSSKIAGPLSRRPWNTGYFDANAHTNRTRSHTAVATAKTPNATCSNPSDSHSKPTILPPRPSLSQPEPLSKDALHSFIDYYDDSTVEEHLQFLRDPYMRGYASADGPNLGVSDRADDVAQQSYKHYENTPTLQNLRTMLLEKLRRPGQVSLDDIFALYQSLPEPRMSHLPADLRHYLLAALGKTERKDSKSMLRYFAVVNDVKQLGFTLTRSEWNTGISFATKYVAIVTETEAEAALTLWREMEHGASIPASEVTFSILFDVASKAGKFTLAEMIYREMNARGYQFNRYHHVSLIHFFGLKQDSSAVRATYKYMVDSGEMIDTTVLNCLISSLLRSGEEESAEHVYEKMKGNTTPGKVLPVRDYNLQKNMTKVLMMFAKVARKHPSMQPNLQGSVILAPNLRTYRILINHHGVTLGNFVKVTQLLDEIQWFRIPLHGSIFLLLFQSFHLHGRTGSDWNHTRLVKVFEAFLAAFDEDGGDSFHISTWMAMYVIRAFSNFVEREELLEVYDELRSRWELSTSDSHFMLDFLDRLLTSKGL